MALAIPETAPGAAAMASGMVETTPGAAAMARAVTEMAPAIPAMGSVWQFWGVAQAAIINGEDPKATWDKLVTDVQGAIG